MDGVTILNEIEVVQVVNDTFNYTAATIALGITVLICAVVGFFIGRINYYDEFTGILVGVLIGLVLSVFTGALFGGIIFEYPHVTETTIQYEVTIDDSVSLTEFYEHYNVIEQRGQIFVVEEKSHDETTVT